jgi:C4-dicarboxylate-specific signal transduction histidine kinase
MNEDARGAADYADEIKTLRAELTEQTRLADTGELAGQVTHKFNNFLNSLLLKIALLETETPELAPKFADLKQQAQGMAEVIKQVHQFQRRQAACAERHDLNGLIRQVAEGLTADAAAASLTIQLALSPASAFVSGAAVDLRRLFSFLLRSRLGISRSAPGALVLRTQVGPEKVLVSLEDTRSLPPGVPVASLFDVDAKGVEGGHRLELGACKALVRRYEGRIQSKAADAGGLMIEAEFPLAAPGV